MHLFELLNCCSLLIDLVVETNEEEKGKKMNLEKCSCQTIINIINR